MKLKVITGGVFFISLCGVGYFQFFFGNGNAPKDQPENIPVKVDYSATPLAKEKLKTALPQKEVRLFFVGDLMFDRYIRQVAEKKGYDYLLASVNPKLLENDVVIANLEGPVTSNPSKSVATPIGAPGHLSFTFDPSSPKTLKASKIEVVNLGNNHTLNFGVSGLEETKKILAEAGIEYFGDIGGKNEVLVKEYHGLKIGFVNYNQFSPGSLKRATDNLRSLKETVDIKVIYTHWGTEYLTTAPKLIQEIAHSLIDEGADLIIGTHPHVIEQKEVYRDKVIYYSLGNFVFDQYFSSETMQGLAVKVTIDPDKKLKYEEIKLQMKNTGQTQFGQ